MILCSKRADGEYILQQVAELVLISLLAEQFEVPKLASQSQDEYVLLLNKLTVLFCKTFKSNRGPTLLLHFARSPASSTTDLMVPALRDLVLAHCGRAVCCPWSTRS